MKHYQFHPDLSLPCNGGDLYIEAKSYQAYIDQFHPLKHDEVLEIGNFRYLIRTQPVQKIVEYGGKKYVKKNRLEAYQGNKFGFIYFDAPVNIPLLHRHGSTWMSLTPAEIMTCRPGVKRSRGHVLLGGLGIAYMAQLIAKRKKVHSITIIESDAGLIEFFEPYLIERHPDINWTFICGDAYTSVESLQLSDYNSIIYDIWEGYGGAYDDPYWDILKERAKALDIPTWGWGDIRHTPEPYIFPDWMGWKEAA